MRRVRSFCEHFIAIQPDQSSPVYHALMTSICVVYAKPFTSNKPVGELSARFGKYSDPVLREFHASLLDWRDGFYAHTEAELFKIHVRIEAEDAGEMMKYGFYPEIEESHLHHRRIPDILRMCDEIEPKLEAKNLELMEAIFGGRHWQAGRITLNLLDES